jgi:hypothetical protein
MTHVTFCDDEAAYRLLCGVVLQARKDLVQTTTPEEMVSDAWTFLEQISKTFAPSRSQRRDTRGQTYSRPYQRDARATPGSVSEGTGANRVQPAHGEGVK